MPDAPSPIEHATAWMVVLPLRSDFVSAQVRLRERRMVLVALRSGNDVGWGEAAPVPEHTTESIDDVWHQVEAKGPALLRESPQVIGGLLGAAVDQARADLDARRSGQPLWRAYGAGDPVPASAAVGINHNGDPDRRLLQSAASAGYRFAKLKVTRFTNPDRLARLVSEFRRVRLGVDANGSLTPRDGELLSRLDELDIDYIEQPGPPDDLDWHVQLRDRMRTPISLDESAQSPEAVRRIIAAGAADIINLKVGRLGPAATLELAAAAVSNGIRVRLGGLVESGVGRAHTVALATHPHFTVVGDIAGSDRYFDDDLVRPQWRVTNGEFRLPETPGIGVQVDEDAVAAHAVASITIP